MNDGAVQMQQSVRFFALTPEQTAALNEQRAAIEDLRQQLFKDGPQPSLIETAQILLNNDLIPNDMIAYQEAIGVIIGDEIVARAGFRWLSVDSNGRLEPGVCHPEKSVFVSPLSAVIKRFKRGETRFDIEYFVTQSIQICSTQAPEASELTLS